jgi:hypothetical protein
MTLAEYAKHVATSAKVLWVDGIPWEIEGRVLRPLAMAHTMKAVRRASIQAAIKETGAALAQWTEGWDTQPCDWWYVCCDCPDYDISNLGKVARYDVRRGLAQCEVRRVDSRWFASNGYPTYAAAFQRYGAPPALNENEFVDEFLRHAEYPGRETWGAFVGERLVAWESCIVVDDAVISSSAKADPAFLKARPNNALVYVLTRHYLRERRLAYVTSGSRVLVHDTNVQEFQEKMGYRKVYCLLRSELSPIASLLSSRGLQKWIHHLGLQRLLKGRMEKLEALAAIAGISRSCLKVALAPDASRPR